MSLAEVPLSGARRGAQVLARLREQPPNLWYQGQQIADVTEHPAFSGGVHTLAGLYDLQWTQPATTLFDSPSSGRKVARSFMIPRTQEELLSISKAMRVWADATHGMMGRLPDYISRAISGYAGGADFLGEVDPRFARNARTYHEYLRERDLCLTHTLIPPQANRAVTLAKQADPYLAARVKEETDAGIVIRGCRMLATLPISDEIMVFPSTLLKASEDDARYAFGFSIPNSTRGLRFICRESLDQGRSHFDHPLGSRYEEMDAVVLFATRPMPVPGPWCTWRTRWSLRTLPRLNSCWGWPPCSWMRLQLRASSIFRRSSPSCGSDWKPCGRSCARPRLMPP
jgi:4-hydroxyphenylacetate 3-monooxygenase